MLNRIQNLRILYTLVIWSNLIGSFVPRDSLVNSIYMSLKVSTGIVTLYRQVWCHQQPIRLQLTFAFDHGGFTCLSCHIYTRQHVTFRITLRTQQTKQRLGLNLYAILVCHVHFMIPRWIAWHQRDMLSLFLNVNTLYVTSKLMNIILKKSLLPNPKILYLL